MPRPKPVEAYPMEDGGVFVRGTVDLSVGIPVALEHQMANLDHVGYWDNTADDTPEAQQASARDYYTHRLTERRPIIGRFRFNPCPPVFCGEHNWHLGQVDNEKRGSFVGMYWPEL